MTVPPPLPPHDGATPPPLPTDNETIRAAPPIAPPADNEPPPYSPGRIVVTRGRDAVPREAVGGKDVSEPPPILDATPANNDAPPVHEYGAPVIVPAEPPAKAPILAMWICLVLAWILLGSTKPFTVVLGAPLDLAAFILAIICITRRRVFHGVLGIIGSIVVSGIIYAIAFGSMALGMLGS